MGAQELGNDGPHALLLVRNLDVVAITKLPANLSLSALIPFSLSLWLVPRMINSVKVFIIHSV